LTLAQAGSARNGIEHRVTVVVATRDRRDSLVRVLEQLHSLPERPPTVVVDNASSDGTLASVRSRFPEVDVIALGENLGAAARTVGVQAAETPFVAFADNDSWWEPGALTLAADVLEGYPSVALLAARVLLEPGGREDPTCAFMGESPLRADELLPGKPVLGFVACGAVVRRSAYLEAGGFHARLHFGGEEQLLALDLARRGWKLVYLPTVVARHEPSPLRDESWRSRRQARNALWFAWLRRALTAALGVTWVALRAGRHDAAARSALLEALSALPWILRERDPVGPELERQLQLLDRQRATVKEPREMSAEPPPLDRSQ
jgi:GT2 family glycosyltransferase